MTNTLNDQLLENVQVEVEEPEGFSVLTYIPIPKLPYGHPATTYTLVEMSDLTTGERERGVERRKEREERREGKRERSGEKGKERGVERREEREERGEGKKDNS